MAAAETKTVCRLYWVWDFEKEERWLNEMALEGWALTGVGLFTYHFIRSEPGEYTIRMEYHRSDPDHLDFMAQTGAEYLGQLVQWRYFRKKAADGPFDLFSDVDSRIRHLSNIARTLGLIGALNIILGVTNSLNGLGRISWINLLCGCLLMYALGRIHGKLEALKAERSLHE